MEAGVPQGSVLGPILFIIFFNDIVETNGLNEIALFADDICLWVVTKSKKLMEIRLQKQTDETQNWMEKWRLKLSVSKTNYTIFNKSCTFKKNEIKITYNGQQIKPERNPKFLGVTLDPGMRLHMHAQSIEERCNKRINTLRRIKGRNWGASSKLIFITYKVLIRSIIEYVPFAPLIMSETNKLNLERIQRRAIRVAIYWPAYTSATEIYKKINLDPILDRAYTLTDKYICKIIATNNIAAETIEKYKLATDLKEGAYCKSNPRKTILGVLKEQQQLKCITHIQN
jgi:hypothetical protein